ncbi:uncharacterized protein EI97DRAFT_441851 [Westerdykella ornata]|uniref:Jacalin-type lectin domain-containing protein n=1 Tax=Westerdykella ornata TaxID=318751 RepID=A0A6A6JKQ2_WESOR|nr:uncharacterized protein EI97DRAFT_441851 [Westerdykella ornata]KAF2277097.1 hypothetical protein EI97DRAFT_441851 [Westerdykella ornata]
MSLTAPYTNAMRIGQGFNTYTQEIRLENAVRVGASASVEKSNGSLDTKPQSTAPPTPPTPPVTPEIASANGPSGEIPTVTINGVPGSQEAPKLARNSRPATPGSEFGGAVDVVSAPLDGLPFEIPAGPVPNTSQSVTYSTRAIENVSDIMDALNISTSMSIRYGTIHGNGNASFVNEARVLDSELNYIVSVIVNNDSHSPIEDMEFQDIPGLPLDRFTEVYGDSFISGFTDGGEFNAVISIKLNDKSKYKAVKQAVDVQLAVGPPTLEIGAKESFEKEHNEALKNTEISISVNWVGGGEIKKPEVPWTIKSVVAVANAFPSMVARSSARTQAVLTRYTSLRSFQKWKWGRLLEEKRVWESDPRNKVGGEFNRDGKRRYEEPVIILNYAPCSLYTADLFDALMNYKKLWRKIGEILANPSQYKVRPQPPKEPLSRITTTSSLRAKSLARAANGTINSPEVDDQSPFEDTIDFGGLPRAFTFNVEQGDVGWNLLENNRRRDPIPPEPVALNEARLLCREAMTLITEEAARLVDHPDLAYAEFDERTKSTRMKRPNYAYPEVLQQRLPVPIHNDILSDLSTDGAYLKTIAYAGEDNIWFEPDMVGDPKANAADLSQKFGSMSKYEDFSSLELTEPHGAEGQGPLRRISLHRYRLSSWRGWVAKAGLKRADNAIGAIGLARHHDDPAAAEADGCLHHLGHIHHGDLADSQNFKALDLGNVDITKIDIAYIPGTGYIAGMTFYDQIDGQHTERLRWRQWEGKEPAGLVHITNEPPDRGDGTVWTFAGLAGSFVDTMGNGHVLARVTGIWKKRNE